MRVALVGGSRWSAGTGRVVNRSVIIDDGVIVELDADPGGTRLIDVGDGLVVPGFIDAHVHPLMAGLRMEACDLTTVEDRAVGERTIAEAASGLADGAWLTGGGWSYSWFERGCPTASLLDRLAPGRPALLDVRDGHSSWANSAALAAAGIGLDTPDPPDGRIERDESGRPTGTLHEGAMRLVEAVVPQPTPEQCDRALERAVSELVSLGITSIQDAWVGDTEQEAWLRRDGGLYVVGALWWDRERGPEQIPEILERSRSGAPGYLPGAVKLMLDGVCENFTASLGEPYSGPHPMADGHRGLDFIPPALVAEAVTAFDSAGLQCHFHAIGDRAVRIALDGVSAARSANGWDGPIHHIAHLQLVDPVDVPRFAQLRVAATCQPLWACNEPAMVDLTLPFLGARSGWMYPFASLSRAGALLAMGSDWPVSTPSVMDQISVATRRRPPGDDAPPPLGPGEALSLDEALTAATLGSARVNGVGRRRGRIRIGNVADLAILERDPFLVRDVAGIGVGTTVLGGTIVRRVGEGEE